MRFQFTKDIIIKQFEDIKIYGIKELFRKFILLFRLLIKIPIYFLALFLCLFIRLIKPLILIRIEKAPSSNFGNFLFSIGAYYIKKKLKIEQLEKKHLDLLYISPNDKIYNKQLAKMWKRKINFLPGFLLEPIYITNKLIPGWKSHTIKILSTDLEKDVDNLIEKCLPLDFTSDEEIYGKEILKKFGLKSDDKFVCLQVRDSAYSHKKISPRFRDWSYHNFRNYNIDDFVMAAESLAERGYYVFRMGVVVEKPLNSKNKKIIDYANTDLRSDFMDIYLGAKCSFSVSTESGFYELPYLFRKPVALIHLPVGRFPTYSDKFLLITKKHILKKEKKELSLSEIFSHKVVFEGDAKGFEKKGVELVDFSPEDINDLALEMVDIVEFKNTNNLENENLQKKFKSIFAKNIENHPKEDHKDISKLHGKIRSRFSSKFLRENQNWLR